MRKRILFISVLLVSIITHSQESFKLDDFIFNSKNSISTINNEKNKKINQKVNYLFKKKFLPDVSLNFTLPGYNRSISSVLQPDGSIAFRESNNANSIVNLSVSQKIPYTGGKISITNSFNRLDVFGDTQNSTSYSASWFVVSLSQPLNFFNDMEWDKKIQDARVEYNYLEYIKENIDIKKRTINQYFELLQIKNEKRILEKELDVAIKYKKIVSSLIKAGKAMAYDSIDVELKLLNIHKDVRFKTKYINLKTEIINNSFNSNILDKEDVLQVPKFNINLNELTFYINRFLEVNIIIERNSLLSLEKNIKQLEKNRFYTANLSVGVGFNNSTEFVDNVFQNPNQSQNLSISLNVPLLDFGKKRIELEMSKIQYEIEESNLNQNKFLTIQQITSLYEEVDYLTSSLKIEKLRIKLLEVKLNRMEKLLYAQKILLKDYSEIENELSNSIFEQINIIRMMYDKIIEIEEITILEII